MTGAFEIWAQHRPKNPGRPWSAGLYPWLDAARSVSCGWCAEPLGSCRCFTSRGAPAEPARPIDIAAFLSSLPKWCRTCGGLLPCDCGQAAMRRTSNRKYNAKARAAGRCTRCTRPTGEAAVCESCRAANRTNGKALRERRESAGFCARCGAEDHASGEHYARIKQAIIDRGDCVTCGKARGESKRQCVPCRAREAERHRARRAAARSPRQP